MGYCIGIQTAFTGLPWYIHYNHTSTMSNAVTSSYMVWCTDKTWYDRPDEHSMIIFLLSNNLWYKRIAWIKIYLSKTQIKGSSLYIKISTIFIESFRYKNGKELGRNFYEYVIHAIRIRLVSGSPFHGMRFCSLFVCCGFILAHNF